MPNVLVRALSGIVYVAAIVGGILLGVSTFCLLFVIICTILLHEFNDLLAEHSVAQVNGTISVISGAYLFATFFCYCCGSAGEVIFAPYILSISFMLISELYNKKGNAIANWAYSFAGQLYIALPLSLLNVLAFNPIYSPVLPLAIFVFLWLNDTGAYCFGCTLSKKIPYKLFPSVSPNKSWVGSVGGGVLVLLGAYIFYLIQGNGDLLFWLGLGLTVCLFGTWGDLVESRLKRTLGVKDSGRFLPGHGGALDRFDSALLAIPAAAAYVLLWGV